MSYTSFTSIMKILNFFKIVGFLSISIMVASCKSCKGDVCGTSAISSVAFTIQLPKTYLGRKSNKPIPHVASGNICKFNGENYCTTAFNAKKGQGVFENYRANKYVLYVEFLACDSYALTPEFNKLFVAEQADFTPMSGDFDKFIIALNLDNPSAIVGNCNPTIPILVPMSGDKDGAPFQYIFNVHYYEPCGDELDDACTTLFKKERVFYKGMSKPVVLDATKAVNNVTVVLEHEKSNCNIQGYCN